MNKIVVITYNILSSNLAKLMIDNNSYTNEIMDDTYRFKLILDYINKQIIKFSKYNLIICLQEVIEEQIIFTLENVVKSWIKNSKGVFLDFSGGTDSTSLLLIANKILEEDKH